MNSIFETRIQTKQGLRKSVMFVLIVGTSECILEIYEFKEYNIWRVPNIIYTVYTQQTYRFRAMFVQKTLIPTRNC